MAAADEASSMHLQSLVGHSPLPEKKESNTDFGRWLLVMQYQFAFLGLLGSSGENLGVSGAGPLELDDSGSS